MEWQNLVIYRETKLETIPLDEQSLVMGLMSLGLTPTRAETDGRKLRIHFERQECLPQFQLLQRALAGILPEEGDPLRAKLEFFRNGVQAQESWRHHLAMMRNYTNPTKYVQ